MKQLVPALFTAGAIMALTGAAVFITGWIYAPYIYTVGAGCIALAQVNTPVKGKSKTLKRLRVQQIFGALALILTGAFMFTTRGNEWIACLTIAAILELYTAFRIPQEEEKEKNKERIRKAYGESASGIGSKNIRKRRHIYIFNPEDLDNADIISMVESSPTYLRDKSTLSTIKTKAATEGQLATEEAQGGEDMGGVITF